MIRFSRAWRIGAMVLVCFIQTAAASTASPFSPVPAPVESFDVGTLHVDKFGSGAQSLVLIPGLACGSWVWYPTIFRFEPHYTIYTITLPGFDGRAATNEKPLFVSFKHDFWAMLLMHKIENPVVIGHSLGGTLAIALAEEHPERLKGIVAVDGLPVSPPVSDMTPQQREAMAAQLAGMYASLSKADEFSAEENYMSTIGTNKPELAEPAARLVARSDPKAIAAWIYEDLTNDLRPNLEKITIPFLEIMPYNPPDDVPPPAYTQEQVLAFYHSLVAGAPKVTVVAVAPARHFVMLDQPDAFYKIITQFLISLHR